MSSRHASLRLISDLKSMHQALVAAHAAQATQKAHNQPDCCAADIFQVVLVLQVIGQLHALPSSWLLTEAGQCKTPRATWRAYCNDPSDAESSAARRRKSTSNKHSQISQHSSDRSVIKAQAYGSLLPVSKAREPVVSSRSSRRGTFRTVHSFQAPARAVLRLAFQHAYGVFTGSDQAAAVWAEAVPPQGKAGSRSRPGSAAELLLLRRSAREPDA